ncbi:MAG TPA: arylsulfatase, partial [Usitatibacteraceae bacterium]|nr:arylsulfatase [Usitatibacteraceae bacterium]
ELGCYGGGALRGAPTPRIDALAATGLRFTNFNVESDCVPTRSALMTGRHPIRTGALQSVPAGLPQGIHPSEITLAQALSGAGYATAIYGKWHLGDRAGRFPHDRGFDHWYGISRTTNESMFTESIGFDPAVVDIPFVEAGDRGGPVRKVAPYDLEMRRQIDGDLTRMACEFVEKNAAAGKPFFLYLPLTQMHFPTIPHRDFIGRTGAGDFADSMVEMDHRVGQVIDCVAKAGLDDDTLFIFASDNGPEFRRPWRGTAGPWTGTYHTAMEGALRVPLIVRWPGRVKPGVTNEMAHVTDLFTTLIVNAGAKVPDDRPIDGVDLTPFLTGQVEKSPREGFVYYIKDQLRALKWRQWKMHILWEAEPNTGVVHLEVPYLFNVVQDPKEETDVNSTQGWVRGPMRKMQAAFQESLAKHPRVPPGAPDDWVPRGAGK